MTPTEMSVRYESCVDLIRDTVWEFIRHNKLPHREYEELFSQSNLYFVLACESYDPDKSKFNTWIYIQIWDRLLKELARTCAAYQKLYFPRPRPIISYMQPPNIDIIDELSSDGLALLILLRNGELATILTEHRSSLRTVSKFLRECGWSRIEIRRAFKEIATLLRG